MASTASKPDIYQRPYIGGQAVIEGVMMRSPRSTAIVVRRRSGALVVRERAMPDPRKGPLALPLVRGVVTLVEAIRLGSQALRFSAEQYEEDLEQEERDKQQAGTSKPVTSDPKTGPLNTLTVWIAALAVSDLDGSATSSSGGKSSSMMTWVALLFAVGLFVAFPQALAALASRLFHVDFDLRSPAFQAMTGVFKLLIVVGYMLVIRRIKEIRRVFEYHGAEHKAIATYEAHEPLDVEHARAKSRLHPRCGTTFLVMVVFVSVLVFSAIGPLLPKLPASGVAEHVLFLLMKLPFLPVIAAITYEIQRLTARYCLTGPLRMTLYPGFAVQRITTIAPDDAQIEVALAALRATLWREEAAGAVAPGQRTTRYESFSELMQQPAYGANGRADAT
ncbi:MAG: DUF1385 domain-containing protein [Polyangiaceae bacterium]|jgi:uncharacterized protein YqhQ|nr:DUF1385 domain-containing protein [Polyangiaceae bacterium]